MGLMENTLLLQLEFRKLHGVEGYARFRDDALLICDEPPQRRLELISRLRKAAHPFIIKVENSHVSECNFLDLHISKEPLWIKAGHLDHSVYRKPTTIWTPLLPSSMHPRSVSRSWPAALSHRHAALCSSASAATAARNYLADALRPFGLHAPTSPIACKSVSELASRKLWSRIVLPFAPHWAAARLNNPLQ